MTRLYELDGDDSWLVDARRVATETLVLFHDGEPATASLPEQGLGFFTTGVDAEALLVRAKDLFDGALPSATAVTAIAFTRLADLLGDSDFRAIAERTVTIASKALLSHPMAVPDLISALGHLRAPVDVAIPGDNVDLLMAARSRYIPFGLIAHGEATACVLLEGRSSGHAYVCRHGVCDVPSPDPGSVMAQIDAAVRI
jgi:hypothetical protein